MRAEETTSCLMWVAKVLPPVQADPVEAGGETTAFDESGLQVLHWLSDEDRWEPIAWDDWLAFLGDWTPSVGPSGISMSVLLPSIGLTGILGGIHYFVVCIHDRGAVVNIIPHKYLVESDGRVGADNFVAFSHDDREDYWRVMCPEGASPVDAARLAELRNKMIGAYDPPQSSLTALRRALPKPPKPGTLADRFFASAPQG